VPLSIKNPALTNEVNIFGTLNLLEASLKAGVKRFVYVFSCAVYGAASELLINESAPPRPISPYASSKLVAEEYCKAFYKNYGFKTVRPRYFNVYGALRLLRFSSPFASPISYFYRVIKLGFNQS